MMMMIVILMMLATIVVKFSHAVNHGKVILIKRTDLMFL